MKNKLLTLINAKYLATFCLNFLLVNLIYSQTNDCTNPTALTVNAASVNGSTVGATQTMSAVTCFYTGNADDDVFYQFTSSVAGYYTVYCTGTGNMDVLIDVRTGECPGSSLGCADNTGMGGAESGTFYAQANTTYFIRIYDYYDIGYHTNASNFNIRVASQYPIITTQPLSQSTCVNTNVSYTVSASSYASQTFQWQRSPDNSTWYTISNNNPTGVTYTGATTNTLNVIGTTAVNNYYYRCSVSAGGNATLTNVVTLAIGVAPAITSNPINNTMFTGADANMSVTATGVNLTYQWQYNNGGNWTSVVNGTPSGAIYTNANTSTVSISGITATGNYQYRCVVSGNCNPSATSGNAILTVYQSSSDSWSVTGNTGTNPGVNYLGTNDAKDLLVKTNNQPQISFEYGSGSTKDKETKLYNSENYPYVFFNGTHNKIGFGSEPEVHDCYESLPERLNTSGAIKMHANTGNAINDEKCIIIGHDGGNGVIDLHIDGGVEGHTPGKLLLGWNSGYDVAIAPDPNPVHDIVGSSSLYVHGKLGVGADAINSNYKLNVGGSVNATEYLKNGQPLLASQWQNCGTGDICYDNGIVRVAQSLEIGNMGLLQNTDNWRTALKLSMHTTITSAEADNVTNDFMSMGMTAGGWHLFRDDHDPNVDHTEVFRVNTTGATTIFGSATNDYSMHLINNAGDGNGLLIWAGAPGANTKAITVSEYSGNLNFMVTTGGEVYGRKFVAKLSSFPDYVFEKDYKLMNLHELEKFILKNKHLPGVPTEKEVISNGIDVAEMQKIQIEKIEEIYLHLIELEKENEQLRRRIHVLENDN
jgi:hypothetical protein